MGGEVRFRMAVEEALELLEKAVAGEMVVQAGLQQMLEELVPALALSVGEVEGGQRLRAVGLAVVVAQGTMSACSGFLEEEEAEAGHWEV